MAERTFGHAPGYPEGGERIQENNLFINEETAVEGKLFFTAETSVRRYHAA